MLVADRSGRHMRLLDEESGAYALGFAGHGSYDRRLARWAETEASEAVSAALEAYRVRIAVLASLVVPENARGRGLGRMLVEEMRKALAARYMLLVADIEGQQLPGFDLLRFYERLGFGVVCVNWIGWPVMAWSTQFAEGMRGAMSHRHVDYACCCTSHQPPSARPGASHLLTKPFRFSPCT